MALKSGLAAYAQLNKKINSSKEDSIRSLQGKFISAKVVSINQLGDGNDGVIECVLLDNVIFNNQESIGGILPLFPNIKNYPLINEVYDETKEPKMKFRIRDILADLIGVILIFAGGYIFLMAGHIFGA